MDVNFQASHRSQRSCEDLEVVGQADNAVDRHVGDPVERSLQLSGLIQDAELVQLGAFGPNWSVPDVFEVGTGDGDTEEAKEGRKVRVDGCELQEDRRSECLW